MRWFGVLMSLVFLAIGGYLCVARLVEGKWFEAAFGLVFGIVGGYGAVRELWRKAPVAVAKHHEGTKQALATLGAAIGPSAYRAGAAKNAEAARVYAPVLATSPLPEVAVQRGATLPIRLLLRKEEGVFFRIGFIIAWHAILIPISLTVVKMIRESPTSFGGWGFGAFMSIFFLAGGLVWVPLVKRALANRKLPSVEISEEPIYLGGTLRVRVDHPKRTRLTKLDVSLVCSEVVSYMEGTTSRTERREVVTIPVLEAHDIRSEETHEAEARLPEVAPHSFASKNNQLEWAVRVHADIPNWPDYDERFVFRALPRPVQ